MIALTTRMEKKTPVMQLQVMFLSFYLSFNLSSLYSTIVLPTRMEKKKTPVIQLQVMKRISGMFCGFLFFPIDVAVFVAK